MSTVMAVPPGEPLAKLVQLIDQRVERDGQVALQAPVKDERRRRQLRRLHSRLASRSDLEDVGGIGTHTTFLEVRRAGRRPSAFYGELVG
jgi:hypothetical protein